MKEITAYYKILDKNLIGKQENFIPYIYKTGEGWVIDHDHILSDRLIGYDGDVIGSSDMLFRVDEISEDEAMKLIAEEVRKEQDPNEPEYICPLLNRVIDDGYCYDINMVASGMIKESVLDDTIDIEKALRICDNCEFNQMY